MKNKILNLHKYLFIVLIVFGILYVTKIDPILIIEKNDDRVNLRKYAQVQYYLIKNYYEPVDLEELHKAAVLNMIKNISDSTLIRPGTPFDTTFSHLKINNIEDSFKAFENVYYYVSYNKKEEDMGRLTEKAIQGMFSTLDPHSGYIPKKSSKAVRENFRGKFEGIGIQFEIVEDTVTVITAIPGGPSDKLGIRSGDRIIEVEKKSTIGWESGDVVNALRGPKGSKVNVTIQRPQASSLLDFTITRGQIPLYTVDTNYMLDEETGYVKVNRFAATTHKEFMNAVENMRKRGMKKLVLDLRYNPGGHLDQAILMTEEFFPKNTPLLTIKGRFRKHDASFLSRRHGRLTDMPVIVLINQGSASASEIVSGAIQDEDRGLIIGERSFGKGLVQQQYNLVDSSSIRVTSSRYYTPSGRLIQKPFEQGMKGKYRQEVSSRDKSAEGDAINFVDGIDESLIYKTKTGRNVYGGGGILPDHIIEEDTNLSYHVFNFMRRKNVDGKYVRSFLDKRGDRFINHWKDNYDQYRIEYQWSRKDRKQLFKRLKDAGLIIDNTIEKPKLKDGKLHVSQEFYNEFEWMSLGFLKAELARQVWDSKHFYPILNDVFDTTLNNLKPLWDEVKVLENRLVEYSTNSNDTKGK